MLLDDWKHDWDRRLFLDADTPTHFLTARQLVSLTRAIGCGLRHPQGAGLTPGDVAMIFAPNSIYVPALLLGILAAGAVVSGVSPAYREKGMCMGLLYCYRIVFGVWICLVGSYG